MSSKSWHLTAVGDIAVDLVMTRPAGAPVLGREILVDDSRIALGGSTAIFAASAARLGLRVRIVGKVGDDPFGEYCLATLRSAGVDVSLVRVAPGERTGITVSLNYIHDRALVTYLGTIANFAVDDVPDAAFHDTQQLHVSSFFLQAALREAIAALFERARSSGATTSLDPGDDPADAWNGPLRAAVRMTDLFIPNEREATRFAGVTDARAALASLRNEARNVIVKLGGEGAIARLDDRDWRVRPVRVDSLDTTGAGDVFAAGFLARRLTGGDARASLAFATAAGALATTWPGGYSDRLSRPAVEALAARVEIEEIENGD